MPGFVALAAGVSCKGCSGESSSTTTATASVSASAPVSASVSVVRSTTQLRLIARATSALEIAGEGDSAMVLAKNVALAIDADKIVEKPDYLRGFENPSWSTRRFFGVSSSTIVLVGKRDPKSLWPGDTQMYGENLDHCGEEPDASGKLQPKFCIDGDHLTVRSFQLGAWMRQDHPREQEFGGIGRVYGRIVAAIATDDEDGLDYHFALIAGKPGINLPNPSRVEKKEPEAPDIGVAEKPAEPTEPAPSASASAEASSDPSAAPSASKNALSSASAPVAKAPPPSEPSASVASDDPSIPTPKNPKCRSRLLPLVFDGLANGEAFLLGRLCGGEASSLWIEHWQPGRPSTFVAVNGLGDPRSVSRDGEIVHVSHVDDLTLVATEKGVATVANRPEGTLFELRADHFGSLKTPASGPIESLVSAGSRLWLIQAGRVFSKKGSDDWVELLLPENKAATGIVPSAGDVPLIACNNELYGPASLVRSEVIDLSETVTSLCETPWVQANDNLQANDLGKKDQERIAQSNIAGVTIYTGYRGMGGKRTVEAKAPNMAVARQLASALGHATILCTGPRGASQMK